MNSTLNLHNRKFKLIDSSGMGEVNTDTIFHYRQHYDLIWATYQGGTIRMGTLSGRFTTKDKMEFGYQHLNDKNEFRQGHCHTTILMNDRGRLQLKEKWVWGKGGSGESILEEI